MVAVRGLARSLDGNYGFDTTRNAMLVNANLAMAGYSGDTMPAMHKRMIETMETIPGVGSQPQSHSSSSRRTGAVSGKVSMT